MFSRQSMCDFLAEVKKKKKKDEEVEDVFVIVTSIQASSRGSMTTNPDKTREPFAHRGQFFSADQSERAGVMGGLLSLQTVWPARSRDATADKRIHSLAGQSDANPAGRTKSLIRSLGL